MLLRHEKSWPETFEQHYIPKNDCVCKDPYTLHFTSAKDAWQKKHLDRDGHDENERESQRRHGGHDCPEDSQTDHLYRCEQMHTQGPHLQNSGLVKIHGTTSVTASAFLREQWTEIY